jgi:hypothetical protein
MSNQSGNIINSAGLLFGKNVKQIENFKVASGFSWREPPVSWIGNIYPTETTYHPLVVNSDYEIATNLFSLEGATDDNGAPLDEAKKNMYRAKIKKIVEDSEYLQELNFSRMIYTIFIISIIILLIFKQYEIAVAPLFGIFLLCAYNHVYKYEVAKSNGLNKWSEFANRLNSEQLSGSTPQAILDKFRISEEHEKELQAKYNNLGMGTNASMKDTNIGIIGLAGLVGLLGSNK